MLYKANVELIEALKKTIMDMWHIEVMPELTIPDNMEFGDLSTNLPFQLARELRRSPKDIGYDIVKNIILPSSFSKVQQAGVGFLNFDYSLDFLRDMLARIIDKPRDFGKPDNCGERIQIEFVSANPTGPLNVVSARAAAVGSSIVNILRYVGHDVQGEYYLNDAGNQIRELTISFILRIIEQRGYSVEFGKDSYRGDYLANEAVLFADKEPKILENLLEIIEKSDLTSFTSDNVALLIKSNGNKDLLETLKNWILERMISEIRVSLENFGVRFDKFFRETELRNANFVVDTLDKFRAEGLTFKNEGAEWFDTPVIDPNEKPFVLIKSDGELTYGAVDIAYHRNKMLRGFDRLYDIWGPDHHGHIGRIKAAIKALKHECRFDVLVLQQVNLLENGEKIKMSKRSGNIVTLNELIEDVGVDVARFFFIARRMEAHLDFDLDLARKESDENPVYYIQYAHARINGILEHAKIKGYNPSNLGRKELASLNQPEELALARKLAQWSFVLSKCVDELAPHHLCFYLIELAQTFHPFYAKHRVVGDDPITTMARVALCRSIKEVLALGLSLLGIVAPDNM
ncbi:arginine--tRNA ligase [bacterium]|nr:arginine--tRNA ligase [bacterium]